MTDHSTPEGKTDLLTPEEIRRIKKVWWPSIQKLCRDYLTLWGELQNERGISDRLMQRVVELEEHNKDLQSINKMVTASRDNWKAMVDETIDDLKKIL